jgi:EAL domain-containing protein (putative c-di-GMP-specific phosphodiesterase class I)
MNWPAEPPHKTLPYLETFTGNGSSAQRIWLNTLPFRIGRSRNAHYMLSSPKVSKEHAEISRADTHYRVRDLGSTNGTFVNGQRVGETGLVNGDILHFAQEEFRFGVEAFVPAPSPDATRTDPSSMVIPTSLVRSVQAINDLIARGRVCTLFQPIVPLGGGPPAAFEALGRGMHPDLSTSPRDLFLLAEQAGVAAELSRLFRTVAVADAARLPADALIFLNTHPAEISDPGLLDQVAGLRGGLRPSQRIVLEVCEDAVTDAEAVHDLRDRLRELGIGLAFDDFGVGQARVMELAEVPPDFIKLDLKLIRNLDRSASRQEVLRPLCDLIRSRGADLIAEGIETPAEAEVCVRLGCRLGQGFLFGRPEPAESHARRSGSPTPG